MHKLSISVGILAWNSNITIRNTLESYKKNKLFDIVNDVTIFFQEVSNQDRKLAKEYNISFIGLEQNIGIGNAFIILTENAKSDNILLLEHDWELVENSEITFNRLKAGIDLLNSGCNVVRYRHRKNPGYPLYTQNVYQGNELNHYDPTINLQAPHLIDCIHWIEHPEKQFPDKINKNNEHFITTSRWSNFTNNPCMYKKDFYLNTIFPFKEIKEKNAEYYKNFGTNLAHYKSVEPWKHSLEADIGYWWSRQNFKIAAGEGLFSHRDIDRYEQFLLDSTLDNKSSYITGTAAFIFAHRPTDTCSNYLAIVNQFQNLGWKTQIYSLFDENDNYIDDNINQLLTTTPDIIIHMDQGKHRSSILKELKSTGAFCIMESGDDPQQYERNLVKAPCFDLILSPDIRSVSAYKRQGYIAEWWPHFADTTIYNPLNIPIKYLAGCSRGIDNGANIIDRLARRYPRYIINQSGFIAEEHNKFLNECGIILQQSKYGEITRRIFEGLACKKLVLTDRLNQFTMIGDIFIENEDIVYYDDYDDCIEKIIYYTNNSEERIKIAERGYKKVCENHSQKQRAEFIIKKWQEYKNL